MLTTLDRLARARELRDAELGQESATDLGRRVMFKRKEDTLRAVLLGKRMPSINDLDLFNPTDSIRLIGEHFDSLAAADTSTRITAAAYLAIVAKYLAEVEAKTGDGNNWNSAGKQLLSRLQDAAQTQQPTYQRTQLEALQSKAPDVFDVPGRVAAASDELNRLTQERKAIVEHNAERYHAIFDPLQPQKDEAFDTYGRVERGEITAEQGEAIRLAYQRLVDERIAAYKAECEPAEDVNRAARRAAEITMNEVGGEIKAGILAASIIPQEQADAWAAAQTIEPGAKASLKKMGYPADKVRSDMAEFYRLTSGRLPALTIRASRGRASAEGIHGHRSSIINIGASFNKRVLFHEMGHHLEADPAVLAAAKGFLAARRESPSTYSLRLLTGNKAYKANEKAYKDSFIDPYVGKFYNDVTEVISMGMESFCDDGTLTGRMRRDPQHFALMTGLMRTPPDPLFGSVKKVFKQIADAEQEVTEVAEQAKTGDLARLAAGVEFVKDDSIPPARWMQSYGPTYLGSYHGLEAYACTKLRDPRTKRAKKGWALVYSPPEYAEQRKQGWTVSGTKWCTYFEGIEQVKAAAKVWARTGALEYLTNPGAVSNFAMALAS